MGRKTTMKQLILIAFLSIEIAQSQILYGEQQRQFWKDSQTFMQHVGKQAKERNQSVTETARMFQMNSLQETRAALQYWIEDVVPKDEKSSWAPGSTIGKLFWTYLCHRAIEWPALGLDELCAKDLKMFACSMAHSDDAPQPIPPDVDKYNVSMNEWQRWAFRGKLDEPWIQEVLDSVGRLDSNVGAMGGRIIMLSGAYDQCMNIRDHDVLYAGEEKTPIRMKMCNLYLGLPTTVLPLPLPINVQICVPRRCTTEDFNIVMSKLPKPNPTYIQYLSPQCADPYKLTDDPWAIGMIFFCGVILVLLVVSTAVDYHKQNRAKISSEPPLRQSIWLRLLLAFSVYSNGRKLISTERHAGTLESVHGIRFLSMAWVVLGHTYSFGVNSVSDIFGLMLNVPAQFLTQIINNATVSVDTFFVMSGFLLSYLFLRRKGAKKQSKSPLFWIMYYVHRYLRLTPVYAVVIMLSVAFYKYLGDGPYWQYTRDAVKICETAWWKDLLYINNFWTDECIGWVWYLANDMQFYWISPIFLLLLLWIPAAGLSLLAIVTLGSSGLRFWMTFDHNWPPTTMASANIYNPRNQTGDAFNDMYVKPWTRIGPYLMGIMFGYIYMKLDGKVRLNRFYTVLIWIGIIGLSWAVLWTPYEYAAYGTYSKVGASFYAALNRCAWALVIIGVIFMCQTGHGGFINALLSWNVIFPLSRLTYCAYLLHPLVIFFLYATRRQPLTFSHYEIVYQYLSALCFTYLLALVFSLAFEAPAMQLEKIIFGGLGGGAKEKQKKENSVSPETVRMQQEEQRVVEQSDNKT